MRKLLIRNHWLQRGQAEEYAASLYDRLIPLRTDCELVAELGNHDQMTAPGANEAHADFRWLQKATLFDIAALPRDSFVQMVSEAGNWGENSLILIAKNGCDWRVVCEEYRWLVPFKKFIPKEHPSLWTRVLNRLLPTYIVDFEALFEEHSDILGAIINENDGLGWTFALDSVALSSAEEIAEAPPQQEDRLQ